MPNFQWGGTAAAAAGVEINEEEQDCTKRKNHVKQKEDVEKIEILFL